ncbi:MAG: beta-galactosidase [Glaciecola sp.]
MRVGVCWYPEQWPRERWADDVALMADVGLQVVRIGEFAWRRMEPARGKFDWEWLDAAVELLAAQGIEVVLGTPSATPPVWLMRERPEILSVGADGRRRAWGSRRHTCPTTTAYRDEANRITAAMVQRYGQHLSVTAWQVDNEPGNHDSARCWCDACQAAFTGWLRARHNDDINSLNLAWGSVFWSQTYDDFDDVRLPVPTMTGHNPGLLLEHLRFASEQVLEGLRQQLEIIKSGAPGRETFTNLYLGDVDVDGGAVGALHGIGAVDSYPHGVRDNEDVGFLLDLTRGNALGPGQGREQRGGRGWVVEQQPGPINWTTHNAAVGPGQVRLWGWQAALHGIDTLLMFRWRAARAGQEQYHTGLLRHDGTPDQGLAETRRLIAEMYALDSPLERGPARIAVLHDYQDAWAVDLDPHVEGLRHRDLVIAAHAGARRTGQDVDVLPKHADFSGYDVILAPALHLANDDVIDRLMAAAESGTTVLFGVRSLVKDNHNAWIQEPMPSRVATALGVRVLEWGNAETWPRGQGAPAEFTMVTPDGMVEKNAAIEAGPWAEVFGPLDGADALPSNVEVLARWSGHDHRRGMPAVVRRARLVLLGASSSNAWEVVVAAVLGVPAGMQPPHVERFAHEGRPISLDHREITSAGLPDVTSEENERAV